MNEPEMEGRNRQCMVRAMEWLTVNDRVYSRERYTVSFAGNRDFLIDLRDNVDCYTGQRIEYVATLGREAVIKLNLNA